MTTAELARSVRHIEITSRKAVTASFAGEYKSAFKGRGIEFDEVRDYVPGDDVRTIDWKVSARMGHLHTRRYVEERELTVVLLVDLSGSGSFGSGTRTKNELAAEISAILAFSAIQNKDRVGLVVFTDSVEKFVPPRKGTTHVLRLIREILAFQAAGTRTGIRAALETFAALLKRRAVVFLVSDFIDEGYERELKVAAKKHDLIAISLRDPRETELPAVGLVSFEDAETGGPVLVDTTSPAVRAAFQAAQAERERALKELFVSAGIDHIPITVGEDHVSSLSHFFMARERRL
jgi:uncharacterized protein (DUF58 family)